MEIVLKMLAELKQQIEEAELSSQNTLTTAQGVYRIIEFTLLNLKNYISSYSFTNKEEEIYFFKELKPQFYHYLIYYVQAFRIETNRPEGSEKEVRKYLKNFLNTIAQFSYDNREFYKYVRSGATYLDEQYFLRNKHDIAIGFDTTYFDCDPYFCTSHDYKMSMLLANEKLAIYLKSEIRKLDESKLEGVLEDFGLGWADTNVGLTELLYGLATSGVFYNKKTNSVANVKQVFTSFQKLLGIDLGNYYRTLQEIRIRKQRTAFYDRVKNNFVNRMDESDFNPR